MRLTPPPKVAPKGAHLPDAPAGGGRGGKRRGAGFWLSLAAFVILAVVGFGVFVILPGQVPKINADPETAESIQVPAEGRTTPIDAAPRTEPSQEPEHPAEPPIPSDPAPRGPKVTAPPPDRSIETPMTSAPSTEQASQGVFAAAIAEGLARLDEGRLDEARQAFESARVLRPASPEAADGLARVESATQLVAIAEHRERAKEFEQKEQWSRARAEYAAVLALDPTIRFARQGESRSGARESLSNRLDRHLENQGRLSEDAVLADAREALEEALEIEVPGAVLAQQIDRLQEVIAIASSPIRVVLLSDGKTDVLVYRVGTLGAFQRRELDLRPGRYTIVGTRAGYHDVRLELEVTPGGSPSLHIQCQEKV